MAPVIFSVIPCLGVSHKERTGTNREMTLVPQQLVCVCRSTSKSYTRAVDRLVDVMIMMMMTKRGVTPENGGVGGDNLNMLQ